jgi:hypothetical protein
MGVRIRRLINKNGSDILPKRLIPNLIRLIPNSSALIAMSILYIAIALCNVVVYYIDLGIRADELGNSANCN